jgi:hypothetical protein
MGVIPVSHTVMILLRKVQNKSSSVWPTFFA